MVEKNELVKDATSSDVVITRIFNAPVELVWKMWTEPKHAMKWWGPKDFTAPFCKIDFRVGGKNLLCMRSKEGQEFWSTGTYLEIVPLKKIVCTDSFADKQGNVVHASTLGFEGDWPMELVVTMLFEDLDGKTKFTLRHSGIPEGENRSMTEAGWNESFDKMEKALEQA